MTAAREMKDLLEGFPNDPESHWTLVLLAQWFGDDEEIRRCADRLRNTKNLSTFAAQCIGTEFFRMGLPIQLVAIITGHKSWENLRRYTELNADDVHKHLEAE